MGAAPSRMVEPAMFDVDATLDFDKYYVGGSGAYHYSGMALAVVKSDARARAQLATRPGQLTTTPERAQHTGATSAAGSSGPDSLSPTAGWQRTGMPEAEVSAPHACDGTGPRLVKVSQCLCARWGVPGLVTMVKGWML